MRKRRRTDRTREDLSDAKERAYAMAIIAISALVAGHIAWGQNYTSLTLGVLIASAIALLVLFAGNEKLARPLMILLKPIIWVVRYLIDLIVLLFSFLAS